MHNLNITQSGVSLLSKKSKLALRKIPKYNDAIIISEKHINEIISSLNNLSDANTYQSKIKDYINIYQSEIKKYINILLENLSFEDKKVLLYNLETLVIKKNKMLYFDNIAGYYYPSKNLIEYCKTESLSHEVLHMASSYSDLTTGTIYTGFLQSNCKNEIGRAINEGYTEILNYRLFNGSTKTPYKRQIRVARLIELLLGDSEKLTHLYFNCNLEGLINEINKYSSSEEAFNLITELDKVLIYESSCFTKSKATRLADDIELMLSEKIINNVSNPESLRAFENIIFQNNNIKSRVKSLIKSSY